VCIYWGKSHFPECDQRASVACVQQSADEQGELGNTDACVRPPPPFGLGEGRHGMPAGTAGEVILWRSKHGKSQEIGEYTHKNRDGSGDGRGGDRGRAAVEFGCMQLRTSGRAEAKKATEAVTLFSANRSCQAHQEVPATMAACLILTWTTRRLLRR